MKASRLGCGMVETNACTLHMQIDNTNGLEEGQMDSYRDLLQPTKVSKTKLLSKDSQK